MKTITLRKHTDNAILYSGTFTSVAACVEAAVKDNVDLSYVNLKHQNLTNANLDNAILNGALLTGANLTGANVSEAALKECTFLNSVLYNSCFAYSDMRNCDFRSAHFGATLIEGSTIRNSVFSTLSCFELDFHLTKDMFGCLFAAPEGGLYAMSRHPIVLKGVLSTPIVILDNMVKIGTKMMPKSVLPPILCMADLYALPTFCEGNHYVQERM